ncbi:MAG: Rieske (2Fe-2S) domain protein [Armatimonadetes bacterium]|nr:Rieske (2Fe-2S) domain protein [Armatimonadota bacterium]
MSTTESLDVFHVIDQQEWTEPVADALEKGASRVLDDTGAAGQQLADFLNGKWFGHPLHPAVTDVPLGAWTAAAVMDAADAARGDDRYAAGSDAAIGVGLAGATLAALSGLADWRHTDGSARKVGVVHASLNGGATLLYAASLALRSRGNRSAGRALSFAGFAAVLAAAYLGGHLSYKEKIGTDHAPSEDELPGEFTAVLADADLPEGKMRKVEADGTPIMLARQGGRVFALAESCAHLGGPLSEGELKEGSVVCPWHGSRFALEDGQVLDGPSAYSQPCLETRVRNGQIEVRSGCRR